jgi:hypothetical protein
LERSVMTGSLGRLVCRRMAKLEVAMLLVLGQLMVSRV